MISSQAKREFEVRYYRWAAAEFQREIDSAFNNFKQFKSPSVWKARNFMESLSRSDQSLLASALLKRFHPGAVSTLKESCSDSEISLRNRFDNFRNGTPSEPELKIAARKNAGEKVKFVSKRKLLGMAADTFKQAFVNSQESCRNLDYDLFLQFEMRTDGWMFYTNFWFGRQQPQLNYCQGISTERSFEQVGGNGPYQAPFPMGVMMSFCSWLGICSRTAWEYLESEDIPIVRDVLIRHCSNFLEAAPKLLQGLEVDTIG